MTIISKTVSEAYLAMYQVITEELHPDIKSILDSESIPSHQVFKTVSKKLSVLGKTGQDSGIEEGSPKKGSSRAVYFPKDHKDITVDGVKTKTPTAIKIAFEGQLDKHHGEDTLLGQDQNHLESDHHINNTYGVLGHHNGEIRTNHDGVLAPVFETHPEGHHLEMGRVEKYNAKDLANHTKNEDFPKGLKHDQIVDSLKHEHSMAHGNRSHSIEPKDHDKITEHPFVSNMISMMHDSGMHPGDLSPRNMGIYVHPVTGHRHPVIIDYGFSNDIAKKYHKARMNISKSQRGW
jgi:hypothetical protein